MKSITTQIEINAPASEVWAALMNFQDYPQWNPFLIGVEGVAEEGQILTCTIQSNPKRTMVFKPIVLRAEPKKEFRWRGKLFVNGLFDGEHFFKLEERDTDTTVLVHGEKFTGLMAGVLFSMIEADTRQGFEAMNEKLKHKVEAAGKEVMHEVQ